MRTVAAAFEFGTLEATLEVAMRCDVLGLRFLGFVLSSIMPDSCRARGSGRYLDSYAGQWECRCALASAAKASPRVDVGDTPLVQTFGEDEHEGKSVEDQSQSDVFPVFVRSLLGPHLVFHVSRRTFGFLLDVGCHGSHCGAWALVQLRGGGEDHF